MTSASDHSSAMAKAAEEQTQLVCVVGSWVFCSVGMLVFNKLAIDAFPVECTLVALQMVATALIMVVCFWSSLHIGSRRDLWRWCRVVPFYSGLLLTSTLALKHAPMSLVIVFRGIGPIFALIAERFFPNPAPITPAVVACILLMLGGLVLYSSGLDVNDYTGVFWVLINNFFAVTDRLLQRLMLAKDQEPVDMSRTSITLVNNVVGMIPILLVMVCTKEYVEILPAMHKLSGIEESYIAITCVIGAGIAYTGIWAQSLISATSFLVLATGNKFGILLLEMYVMHTKQLTHSQIAGACIVIFAGVAYGKASSDAQKAATRREDSCEKQPLVAKKV